MERATLQFRKDINGLRAFAVIAVMLFHFNSSWMPGGFAGVDVFFVISGFLMTGIIFRGIEQDNFSILTFYVARANRIVPALAVLCFVLLVFGWFYLIPADYKALGKHVGNSIGFFSNIIYWHEIGYFDVASREKWLLHTWSLSVEWQFYMLYPLALVAMRKFMSLKAMKLMVLTGAILGFTFCVIATYKWPGSAYYLLPTRAWEMMLGGVAYLYPRNTQHATRNVITYSLEWLGLTLIAASFFLISKENPWPGYLALIPVFGAFLVIQAQRNDSFITGNLICQKIGSWSYSIYLWHWPLVVAIYYFSLSSIFIYPAIVLSILLGFISNKYIEKIKFRKNFENLFEYLKCKPIWMVLIIGIAGCFIFITTGLYSHYSIEIQNVNKEIKYPHYCHVDGGTHDKNKYINCKVGNQNKKPIGLIWGDSYAGVLDPFVINIIGNKQSFTSRTTSYCFPSLDTRSMLGTLPDYCSLIRKKDIQEVKERKYKIIFLAGRWDHMYETFGDKGFNSVMNIIDFTSKNAKEVYFFFQPVLYKKNIEQEFIKSLMTRGINHEKFNPERNDFLAAKLNKKFEDAIKSNGYPNVHIINRNILYGNDNDLTKNGLPYTYDEGHLSEQGSVQASKHFMSSSEYLPLKLILDN